MANIDQYLRHGMANRASDMHFSSGEPVRFRIDGDLVAMDQPPLTNEQIGELMFEILNEAEHDKLIAQKALDKSYGVEGLANFRLNIFYTRRGIAAVIRSIPSKIPTMAGLGLPDAIQSLTTIAKGLVLVTGPTGSGKSTTLAAMLNHINANYPYHILTVEDPVEFIHPSQQCLVNQREIGTTCLSFSDALKYALREDPDIILVGELRDLETIGLALTAAETGHLVFGTLHTRGAGPSVDRIIDSFPSNQQGMVRAMLAESLMGVVSQVLCKRKDGKGRVAAYEIMITNHAISNLIREGKTFQVPSVIQTGRREGMILMAQHLKELIASGTITEEEAAPYLDDDSAKKDKASGPPRPSAPPPPPAKLAAPPSLGKAGSPPAAFTPKPMETAPATPPAPRPSMTPPAARPAATPPPVAGVRPPPVKPPPISGGGIKPIVSAPPLVKAMPPAAVPKQQPAPISNLNLETEPTPGEEISLDGDSAIISLEDELKQMSENTGAHRVEPTAAPTPGAAPVMGTGTAPAAPKKGLINPFKKTG